MSIQFDPHKICQNLRCKEMYAQAQTPDPEAEPDPFPAVYFWCTETRTGRGPDGDKVRQEKCSLGTTRACFKSVSSYKTLS